ncbi:hypothetical protein LLE49_28230 [Alicyclobacillus tolerans]|uniref:hypothetical protein n=1 Tax=Alicyclobacillus tolerans TaxID=90970 RepID=UPI001F273DD0|nr:hypothetical protein [Alicyclobacillus tolerans]MCF8568610.1 hypothetical protein [Alicyclobacillus tolerans]
MQTQTLTLDIPMFVETKYQTQIRSNPNAPTNLRDILVGFDIHAVYVEKSFNSKPDNDLVVSLTFATDRGASGVQSLFGDKTLQLKVVVSLKPRNQVGQTPCWIAY